MIEHQTLPNGVRIVTEPVPGMRSAALGIWVGTGSRHERAQENGAAHFIEHMVFKGTDRRTAAELAQEMDAIGGQVNAFTTKECTCFHARVLDRQLPRAADLLCDMVFHSRFDEGDVATERGVILEEIGMYEDNPEDLCAERLTMAAFGESALARPILGSAETLGAMTGESLRTYMAQHYRPQDIVVALAGSFTPADVAELERRFGALPAGPSPAMEGAAYRPAVTVKYKPIEQNHLTLAFPGLTYGDGRRYQMQLLSAMLGAGMSSRLWQEVREKRGLCYSVYSYAVGHADTGLFGVYTAVNPEAEEEAMEAICRVIADFAGHGPGEEELRRAREQAKANVLMGQESTQNRMSALGRGELLHRHVYPLEEVLAGYDAVTTAQVRALAEELFDFRRASLSAVGRVGEAGGYAERLGRMGAQSVGSSRRVL